MKTPTQLKNIHQLSKDELQAKAKNILDTYIEPLVIEAIKNYQNHVSIKLNYDVATPEYLYGYPLPNETRATPLSNEILKYAIRILERQNYEAFISDDTLRIEWE